MSFLRSEVTLLTNEEAEKIHEASLKIIAQTGMKVEHERLLKSLDEFGADVDYNTMIVKFPRNIVEDCLNRYVDSLNADVLIHEQGKKENVQKGQMSLNTHIFCVNLCDADTSDIRPATLKNLEQSIIIANELHCL